MAKCKPYDSILFQHNEWSTPRPQLQSKAEEGRKVSQVSEAGISQRVACYSGRQVGGPGVLQWEAGGRPRRAAE